MRLEKRPFSRVRGTQDLLDLRLHRFILKKISSHLEKYNFDQIQTPVLEQTDLFIRSLGEQTDVVTKEMYVFQTSSGESICLRPEATAGTMRAFLENHIERKPWKVWSYGPMFRHERPQKGRWRQFEQINIEIIEAASIAHDAFFIKMLDSFFSKNLLLENYVLKLNFLGCLDDRKRHKEALVKFIDGVQKKVCKTCLARKEKNILRVFDCKNEDCQAVYVDAPKMTGFLCDSCSKEWSNLQEFLQLQSVSFICDHALVRGLDYYNKTVFEFTSDELGAQSAFCGGGRYELSKELGAKVESPSIGAAIGFGRLLMLVDSVKDKLSVPHDPALHVVIPMGDEQKVLALLIADKLQSKGLCADVLLDGGSMKSLMRKANKMGAAHVLIIGEDEMQNGTVSVKNMKTGESESVKQGELEEYL